MIIYRHILKAHLLPFLFSLTTLMFIFLLQFLMKFVDELIGKGLSWLVIFELIALNLAWMVVLAIPMAVLISVLMAFGGLSSQNEITAMKASGISLYRMMFPVMIAGVLITYFTIEFNDKILPEANHKLKTLMIDIRKKKPTLTLNPGMFSHEISGHSILVQKTFEHSNDLEGITIYDYTDPQQMVIVTADKGKISFTSDFRKLIMDLEDGEIHQIDSEEKNQYRKIKYEKHRILMDTEGFSLERSAEGTFQRGDRELNVKAMKTIVDSLENEKNKLSAVINELSTKYIENNFELTDNKKGIAAETDSRSITEKISSTLNEVRYQSASIENNLSMIRYNDEKINEYLVEIHKKYSIPFACIVFVLIGSPLGIMSRRGGFGISATLSLGFFLLYWACLIGGEKLADRDIITPFIGMWSANIILGIMGVYLMIRIGRETTTIKWTFFRKFIPKFLRAGEIQDEEVK